MRKRQDPIIAIKFRNKVHLLSQQDSYLVGNKDVTTQLCTQNISFFLNQNLLFICFHKFICKQRYPHNNETNANIIHHLIYKDNYLYPWKTFKMHVSVNMKLAVGLWGDYMRDSLLNMCKNMILYHLMKNGIQFEKNGKVTCRCCHHHVYWKWGKNPQTKSKDFENLLPWSNGQNLDKWLNRSEAHGWENFFEFSRPRYF